MTISMLDLAPREQTARGTGSNTETTWTPPAPDWSATGHALARAIQPGYFDWLEHVRAASGCTRPIRLTGDLYTVSRQGDSTAVLDHRHTDHLPDAAIYKACGNRRATVCPACARTYQRDAYQILRAGLIGGKGIPHTVARHPAVFLTLTAPTFGTVHTRHVRTHTCRDRKRCTCRPDTGLCQHDQPAVCWARHEPGDPQLGRPLCLDCYDHDHHVVWNLFAGELWHRTKQDAERYLAKLCRARGIPFHEVCTDGKRVRRIPPVRLSHGKAAEMQRRGAVHFHALIRLDGVNPHDLTAVVPPPPGIDIDDLVDALTAAAATTSFDTPEHPHRAEGWSMAWGDIDKGFDVRPITLTGSGDVTDSMAAGYLAKYATKSTEVTGYNSTRITADTITEHADPDGDHIARLIHACWHLGHTPDSSRNPHRTGLLRASTGPKDGPFIKPWDSQDCGGHTRYRVCPQCAAERQAALDTKPAKTTEANPYPRLRRWAHMLGFGGHFLTKARRYSVTFRLLRDTRINFRRAEDQTDADTVRTVDHLDETTLIVGVLTFAGVGWHNTGDALLANTAAAMARERQAVGREELAHEAGHVVATVATAA